jgi:hypothetical protein
MAISTQVRLDESALKRIESAVRGIPNAMNRIVPPGLNRTASWLRTRDARAVAHQIGSKVGQARRQIQIEKATRAHWLARVLILDAVIPLIHLKPRQTARGVRYRLGEKVHTRRFAFMATMPSGHRGVFKRGGRPRLPIYEQAIRLHRALNVDFLPPLSREAGIQLAKEIQSKTQWVLQRAAR